MLLISLYFPSLGIIMKNDFILWFVFLVSFSLIFIEGIFSIENNRYQGLVFYFCLIVLYAYLCYQKKSDFFNWKNYLLKKGESSALSISPNTLLHSKIEQPKDNSPNKRDNELEKLMVGKWRSAFENALIKITGYDQYFTDGKSYSFGNIVIFDKDIAETMEVGRFVQFEIEGTWIIKNSQLTVTTTKTNVPTFHPVGEINTSEIVHIDESKFIEIEEGIGEITLYKQK